MARVLDAAPRRPVGFAEAGLSRGWEPAALVTLVLLLLAFGLVTLYSASAFKALQESDQDTFYVLRQAGGAALGLAAMVLVSRFPFRLWKRLAWPLMWVTWFLLILIILPGTQAIAPEINGARRWLQIGFTFQPSELAKLAIIVWSAALCVKKEAYFSSLRRGLLPFLVVWAALILPILLEPDLSTAALVGMLGAIVVFAGGARFGHFVFLGLLMMPVVAKQLLVGFRMERLLAFMNLSEHSSGAGFQVRQSLIAVGSGGLTGVGFGEGRQKFGFLPEAHNDFIMAMVGEEWGLLGMLFLILMYLAIVVVGFRIARRTTDMFGQLLAVGFSSYVALHAVLHMAVGLALVPPTGLPLPLVSYGRSNLLITLVGLGIVLSVARDAEEATIRGERARAEVDLARPMGETSGKASRSGRRRGGRRGWSHA